MGPWEGIIDGEEADCSDEGSRPIVCFCICGV